MSPAQRWRLSTGRLRGRLPLLAAAFGLAAAALVLIVVAQQTPPTGAAGGAGASPPGMPVVVARDAVPAGSTLTAEQLTVVVFDAGTAPAGAVARLDAATGRVLRYPLARGEPVLDSKLVSRGAATGQGLAFAVPPGARAVAVNFSDVMGAGGLVVPGDRVDVLVATTLRSLAGPADPPLAEAEQDRPAVLTLLQDVLVLAVGHSFTQPAEPGQDPATLRVQQTSVPEARTVTLAVSAADAQRLFFAAEHGKLALALRPFGDQSTSPVMPDFRLTPAGQ